MVTLIHETIRKITRSAHLYTIFFLNQNSIAKYKHKQTLNRPRLSSSILVTRIKIKAIPNKITLTRARSNPKYTKKENLNQLIHFIGRMLNYFKDTNNLIFFSLQLPKWRTQLNISDRFDDVIYPQFSSMRSNSLKRFDK